MPIPTFIQNLVDSINQWDFHTLMFLSFWSIFSLTWYYSWIFFVTKSSSNLPPGPRGIPLFGNLLSLNPELHSYFASLSQTYGPIFSLRLGTKYSVVITSPSIARQVLKDHDIIFANHDATIASKVVTYGGCDVVFSPYGTQWRMLRKLFVQWIATCTTFSSVHSLCRRQEVRKAMNFLYSRVGSSVDIGELMIQTVLNINTNMIWGEMGEGYERSVMEVEFSREVMKNVMELVGKPNLSDFFPGLAWFDLQGVEKQMNLVVERFDQIFGKMIKQRLNMKKDGIIGREADVESKDFLGYLFKLKDQQKDSNTPITMDNVKALIMEMMIGGTDTTSNTIEFAMAHLINEPKLMKRMQEELNNVVGKNNMVEEFHIQKLPYLLAVMKETLRLHPIFPLLVPHCPTETTIIGNYTIPKGSQVFLNVWAIHRDPSIWDNPLQFDPSRFFDAQYDFKGNDYSYLPFGSGQRICAGMVMAERTFLNCVATLIHLFEWKIPPGQVLDISEKFGVALKKKMPLVVIPTPRLSNLALYE